MTEETAIQKALRHSGIELSILLGLDESPIPSDVCDGMRKTLALIDEAAPAAAVAEEHYQAATAMSEKHRKLWVEACQERDRMRSALQQCEDYFDGRADVKDGDYGVPEPNTEMQLLAEIREALGGTT